MKKCFISLMLFFMTICVCSCERNSQQIGGKPVVASGSSVPVSEEMEHPPVYAMAKGAGITEVLPGEGSGNKELDGKGLFVANCSACHQATGLGIPGVFPPLVESDYVTSDNVQRLAGIMIYGLNGPVEVKGTEYNGVMAGLGAVLDDNELSAIATYIRSAWGNNAEPVKPEVFTETRNKYGSRGLFTIDEFDN